MFSMAVLIVYAISHWLEEAIRIIKEKRAAKNTAEADPYRAKAPALCMPESTMEVAAYA